MSDNERSGPTGDDDLSLPKGTLNIASTAFTIVLATVQKLDL